MREGASARAYHIRDDADRIPPQYKRAVEALTNDDLRDELRIGKGDPGFQAALRVEAARRGLEEPCD